MSCQPFREFVDPRNRPELFAGGGTVAVDRLAGVLAPSSGGHDAGAILSRMRSLAALWRNEAKALDGIKARFADDPNPNLGMIAILDAQAVSLRQCAAKMEATIP